MEKWMTEKKVQEADLFHPCDLSRLNFRTTDDLEELTEALGQERASEAMRFGFGIAKTGFNLFAMGPSGAGKFSTVRAFLEKKAAAEAVPSEWCYVYNFEEAHRPHYLRFPPGRARQFQQEMERCVGDIRVAVPATFESEEYRIRKQEIEEELGKKQEQPLKEIRERAKRGNIALVRTPGGLAFAPTKDSEVLPPHEYKQLPTEEKVRIEKTIEAFQTDLGKVFHQRPKWHREAQNKTKELSRELIDAAVASLLEELRKNYDDLPDVLDYLNAVQADLVENADHFQQNKEGGPLAMMGIPIQQQQQQDHGEAILRRYQVNILVDHSEATGAPVIYEDNPTFQNLVGRIEHIAQMGALVTDFTLIKPGALHRANGGYLLLDARKVLTQVYAWEGLKRSLKADKIQIESLGQALSLLATASLEPQAIPLQVKIVLVGERLLYYLLYRFDTEFADFFKVVVDFEEEIDRSDETAALYARWVAGLVRHQKLQPFDPSGVGRVIEEASRLSGDGEKVSVQLRGLSDLLQEADHWARQEGRPTVAACDVQHAIDSRIFRSDRARSRLRQEIERGRLLIDTEGERTGQINGLSILQLGDFMFGNPSRITARTRVGPPKVVDIEREVEMGGAIHSKGVLILSGFLSGRYLPDQPLSMTASLVFEQNYGGVEGDSASSAELYALLSSLADAPIRQWIGVTGSVNQHGQVQAIGGVNQKIEGFFDVCQQRGLTGRQGVMIPSANKSQLMLRHDVLAAVQRGEFSIYAVARIDEGIEILTGVPAGERGPDQQYTSGSINRRVEERLQSFAERARAFQRPPPENAR